MLQNTVFAFFEKESKGRFECFGRVLTRVSRNNPYVKLIVGVGVNKE